MTADSMTQDALPLDLAAPEPEAVAAVEFARPAEDGERLYDIVPSPLGDLLLTAEEAGAVLTGLHLDPARFAHETDTRWRRAPAALAEAADQLAAYFAGERTAFTLALAPAGTAFQRQVWRALTTIPYGRTATYGEIARAIGQPNAARAVGMANNRNPISIVIPCHRVIGANGAVVGYGGGLPRKQALLHLERSTRRPAGA
ncbi:methylated-DNA--[protein]-cysteine S-methyltransferase [Streptomonospora nanhaiensis]|uniref:methylated-DNA--[protein]-cysteine S-methyltransferase n=1 Tax=Streptomonospora nanhaiensis TaxID=1323731 RepID=UPI00237C62DA|nr:methylated-DNA--[protein]-cysteine S-methyltransferase [Streptomonospora nanhaiensis]